MLPSLFLLLLAIYLFYQGSHLWDIAENSNHQIMALLYYLMSAVMILGIALIDVISDQMKLLKEIRNILSGDNATIGIGVLLSGLEVTGFNRNSWAKEAGMRKGDVITEIDGDPVTADSCIEKLRGQEGTKVKIKVRRGNEFKKFEITRRKINKTKDDNKKWR